MRVRILDIEMQMVFGEVSFEIDIFSTSLGKKQIDS